MNETAVDIGSEVHVHGTGCPPPYGAEAGVVDHENRGGGGGGAKAEVTPDGTWDASFTVDTPSPVGLVQVSANCRTATSEVFFYKPVPIDVHTFRHLRLDPADPVAAGATVAIRESGHCPEYSVDGVLVVVHGVNPDKVVIHLDGLAGDGSWSGTVTLPGDVLPGTYPVEATCYGHRFTAAHYEPVDVIVRAG